MLRDDKKWAVKVQEKDQVVFYNFDREDAAILYRDKIHPGADIIPPSTDRPQLSRVLKTRWKECEKLAEVIGTTKHIIYNHLFEVIKAKGWMDGILHGNQVYIEQCRQHISTLEPFISPKINGRSDHALRPDPDELAETPQAQITVAMWFIRKVGSPAAAMKALKAATAAVQQLEGKKKK